VYLTLPSRQAGVSCPALRPYLVGHVHKVVVCKNTTDGSFETINVELCRSSEMPKRDEEKEIERKARAKRARESRRSTQVN